MPFGDYRELFTCLSDYISLAKAEAGTTAIEYALLSAVVGLAVVAGVNTIGASLESTFQSSASVMDQAALAGTGGSEDTGNEPGNGNGH